MATTATTAPPPPAPKAFGSVPETSAPARLRGCRPGIRLWGRSLGPLAPAPVCLLLLQCVALHCPLPPSDGLQAHPRAPETSPQR
ncbi:hypothetical protein AAFF_G00165150 [Aldrovandia affinis]|uniref:Uncharacterized protein n=1 Tax=Aldrovandia affinis TaxID=143900 RepID=A0AAD7RM99_9TELE|nr:hypothetical protein AAFF_G00165150 [Aldrovandia affinis]